MSVNVRIVLLAVLRADGTLCVLHTRHVPQISNVWKGPTMRSLSRRIIRRWLLMELAVALCALALLLLLTQLPTPTTHAAAQAPASANVAIGNFFFSPQVITVAAGTPVVWTNTSGLMHTVTITDVTDSGPIAPGQSFTFTFGLSGTFPYFCAFHPSLMQATAVVTAERALFMPLVVR